MVQIECCQWQPLHGHHPCGKNRLSAMPGGSLSHRSDPSQLATTPGFQLVTL